MNADDLKNVKIIKGKGKFPTPKVRKIYPSKALLWKYYLQLFFIWLTIGGGIILVEIFFLIYLRSVPKALSEMVWLLYWLTSFLTVIPSIILLSLYVQNMEYAVHGDEVIVKKGLINRTVKYCPFRTVTNISTRAGIFDRLFHIGNVFVETAGKGGEIGPEEKLEGLILYHEIRDYILNQLRTQDLVKHIRFEKPTYYNKINLYQQYLIEIKELKKLLISKKGGKDAFK